MILFCKNDMIINFINVSYHNYERGILMNQGFRPRPGFGPRPLGNNQSGFWGPVLLCGLTGGLISPIFYNNRPFYPNYYPYYYGPYYYR